MSGKGIIVVAVFLGACASSNITTGISSDDLVSRAESSAKSQKFNESISYYKSFLTNYPYDPRSQRALLDLAEVYYLNEELIDALSNVDLYLKLYPVSEDLARAYYLRGLINFPDGKSFLGVKLPIYNDLTSISLALKDFRRVASLYAQSEYAEKAVVKIKKIEGLLSDKELQIAEFYLTRGAYLASANRASQLLLDYYGDRNNERAIEIMVESYSKLELKDLLERSLKIMSERYPDSDYLKLYASK